MSNFNMDFDDSFDSTFWQNEDNVTLQNIESADYSLYSDGVADKIFSNYTESGDTIFEDYANTLTPSDALVVGNESDDLLSELIEDSPHVDNDHSEVSFLGHSQSEINHHKSQAEHDIREAERIMRQNKSIAESKARMGEPHGFEDYQYQQAKHRLEEAKSELYKWSHMRPDR